MISSQDLYSYKEECCGCELCALACNHNVISMQPDSNGFLYPQIDNPAACVNCRRCVNLCPIKHSSRSSRQFLHGFGGSATFDSDVRKSASGGLSYSIGRKFIEKGGIVYGVEYTDDCRLVKFSRAVDLIELERFRTSKYVQARKYDIYQNVKEDLRMGAKVLFVGLSCEVSALYNFLSKEYEGLYTIALMCHGTTSPRVHREFCDALQEEYQSKIQSFSVRHKIDGWKPYYIKANFTNGRTYIEQFVKTDYEIAFKYLKRPSCYSCKFKLRNQNFGFKADLIIGDFHGARPTDAFFNKWGASRFYSTSDKGLDLIESVKEVFCYYPISLKNLYNSSPVLNYPTQKLLFSSYYANLFSKHNLHKASSNLLIKVMYKYYQPISKKYHECVKRISARLKKI